jgi:hypothetical protein
MDNSGECNQSDHETHVTFKLVTSRGTLTSKYNYQKNLPKLKHIEEPFSSSSDEGPSSPDPQLDISNLFIDPQASKNKLEEENEKPQIALKEIIMQSQEAMFATPDSFLQPNTALEQFGELRAPVPDSYYFDGNSMRNGHLFFQTARSDLSAKLAVTLSEFQPSLSKRVTVFVTCDTSYHLIADGKNQYLDFYTVSRDVSSFYGNVDFRLENTGQLKIKVKKGKLSEFVIIAVLRDRDGKYIEAAPLMHHGKVCSFSSG